MNLLLVIRNLNLPRHAGVPIFGIGGGREETDRVLD
jgi:hypothetical protein